MKVICFECNKRVGEKAPFSDHQVTVALCQSCWRKKAGEVRKNSRRQMVPLRRYGSKVDQKAKRR